jgi:hypothetical protein
VPDFASKGELLHFEFCCSVSCPACDFDNVGSFAERPEKTLFGSDDVFAVNLPNLIVIFSANSKQTERLLAAGKVGVN